MPQHDTYVLHIWRSRTLRGWQWVARLESASDGRAVRFSDPAALLDHLHGVVWNAGDPPTPEEKGGP
jgi:hypothetical protein